MIGRVRLLTNSDPLHAAYLKTHLETPRLCITLTITYRDDPRLVDLLERTSASARQARTAKQGGSEGAAGHASKPSLSEILAREALEQDEYMVESFDGQSKTQACCDHADTCLRVALRCQSFVWTQFILLHRSRVSTDSPAPTCITIATDLRSYINRRKQRNYF